MEGVGRVTAGRVLDHFASYDALLGYPREQVLLRIKGAPKAEALIKRLFDEDAMRERLRRAEEAVRELGQKEVGLFAPHDAGWPAGLADLPRPRRPVLLYAFGRPAEVFQRPVVALLARPPVEADAFEQAQTLAARLAEEGCVPATGAANGFDAVMHKRAEGGPSAFVAHCGLAAVPSALRPVIAKAVRAGGLLLSSFPLRHGPFDHDDTERALVLAALAGACVFAPPRPETPEARALDWALGAGRPVFGLGGGDAFPENVRRLGGAESFDAVLDAARG